LKSHGVNIIQKPFSVGLRIEHPQSLINKAQFGKMTNHPALPAADYKLSDECYTFCMCPGGYVVAAASEEDKIVTNGMSFSRRDGENANSALLVNVGAEDFGSEDALAGVWFQQDIESKAFKISESYKAPCQKLSDFLEGKPSQKAGEVMPTYEPGVVFSDVRKCLPYKVTEKLKRGIYNMDKHLSGFAMPDALLTAPETRSSSPVRIVRDKDTCMSNIKGLFPCGEGAGYAGGIMSAAADGIRCAVKMIELFNRGDIDE
ncbi:MAG: hypothetical protein Q8882_09455, partial [Bacillota bacterium]|nr:hypothetical protein [Bacillota bacterium]